MVVWCRHLSAVLHQSSNRCVHKLQPYAPISKCFPLLGSASALDSTFAFSRGKILQPFHHHLQHLGIFTSRHLLSEASVDANVQPVPSPLTPLLGTTGHTKGDAVIKKPGKVQGVLKGIKQSPKKVNLVAAFVRGMRVEDALLQLQVTVKRAAKAVYKRKPLLVRVSSRRDYLTTLKVEVELK